VTLGLHVPCTYVFLNSTHIFIGSAKISLGTMTHFLGIYRFMLSNQFLNYMFKLSINTCLKESRLWCIYTRIHPPRHSFTMQQHSMIGGNFYPTLLDSAVAKTVTTLCASTGPFPNFDKQHYMCYRWYRWDNNIKMDCMTGGGQDSYGSGQGPSDVQK